MKLNLVIAESALELVPMQVKTHPAVVNDAKRRGVESTRILLDRTIHQAAMKGLSDEFKRGRPDLVHTTLLSVTSTPLYQDGVMKVYVHTINDTVLDLQERTRPPKGYFRFRNLVEKLLAEKPRSGLIKVNENSLRELLKTEIRPDVVFGLSVQGRLKNLEELAANLVKEKRPAVLIGGFAHGHFTSKALEVVDELVRINDRPLDAHVVASRLVYEVEKAVERK